MSLKTILSEKGGEVISIDFTADLSTAAKLLTERRIGVLAVIGVDGRLAGILSERDIVRAIAKKGDIIALRLSVAEIMTRNVSTCDVSDSIGSVMERMTEGRFRHIPVFDEDRLVGLVSIGDLIKYHLDTLREQLRHLGQSMAEFELFRL